MRHYLAATHGFTRLVVRIILSVTVFCCSVHAEDAPERSVSIPPVIMGYLDFPPLMWDEDGVPTGSLIDLTNEIAADQQLSIQYVFRPVKRLYTDLARGDIHLWIGSPNTTEIKDKVLFTDPPVVVATLKLYAKKPQDIPLFSTLRDTSIIIINGYRYGGLWSSLNDPKRNLSLLPAMNHQAALGMLRAGRATYVLDYERPTVRLKPETIVGEFNQRIVQAFPSHYNVSKNAPQPEALLDRLTVGLKRALDRRAIVNSAE